MKGFVIFSFFLCTFEASISSHTQRLTFIIMLSQLPDMIIISIGHWLAEDGFSPVIVKICGALDILLLLWEGWLTEMWITFLIYIDIGIAWSSIPYCLAYRGFREDSLSPPTTYTLLNVTTSIPILSLQGPEWNRYLGDCTAIQSSLHGKPLTSPVWFLAQATNIIARSVGQVGILLVWIIISKFYFWVITHVNVRNFLEW